MGDENPVVDAPARVRHLFRRRVSRPRPQSTHFASMLLDVQRNAGNQTAMLFADQIMQALAAPSADHIDDRATDREPGLDGVAGGAARDDTTADGVMDLAERTGVRTTTV